MERMAEQQRAAGSSLASLTSGDAADGVAAEQAQQLMRGGNIATGGEAAARLRGLNPPIQTRQGCDALLEALENNHDKGNINLQTYRVYADSLMTLRRNLPVRSHTQLGIANNVTIAGGPRADIVTRVQASNAVRAGATAEQAIAANNLTHPQDIAEIRAEAARVPRQYN
jgi:hypothetical protein